MILGNGLLTAGTPSFGTLAADSSDSSLFSGYTPNVAAVMPVSQRLYFGKSGGEWTTLWTDTSGALLRGDEAGTYAVVKASDGPSPFDSDTGLATDVHAGSVSGGTTFVHEADCLIEFTVTTLATSGYPSVQFRYVDANNFWLIEIEGGNGSLRLYERVSGTYSQRGFAASAVSDGKRIVTIADNQSISIYADNTKLFTYANAANFATATAGLTGDFGTGGAVSDLITWPRQLSGTAAAILNKASA